VVVGDWEEIAECTCEIFWNLKAQMFVLLFDFHGVSTHARCVDEEYKTVYVLALEFVSVFDVKNELIPLLVSWFVSFIHTGISTIISV
jgi:hypothetical protein